MYKVEHLISFFLHFPKAGTDNIMLLSASTTMPSVKISLLYYNVL